MFGKKITFINHRLAKATRFGEKNVIQFRDHVGREHLMSKQEWVDKFLPRNLKDAWSNPDHLASLIIQALKEELYQEMLQPAEHLQRIDPDTERSTSILVMIYLKLHRIKDMERMLLHKMNRESGINNAPRVLVRW